MWMGSSVSTADEWIELKNLTNEDINFDKTPWKIILSNSKEININEGLLVSNGYFLISNNEKDYEFSGGESILNIDPDIANSSLSLLNDPVTYSLYDSENNLVDEIRTPLSGENKEIKKSMERIAGCDDGTKKECWQSCYKAENLDPDSIDYATPRASNSEKSEEDDDSEEKVVYNSAIRLNEILPNPKGKESDEEYIEIYNESDSAIDLKDWILRDSSKTGTFIFPENSILESKKYLAIYRKDFKFAINNSNESIYLLNPNEEIVSSVSYTGSANENISYGLDTNSWRWSKYLTPGEKNKFSKELKFDLKKIKSGYANIPIKFEMKIKDKKKTKFKYRWDFGDGRKSYIESPSHTFYETGKFKISLTLGNGIEEKEKSFSIAIKKYPRYDVSIYRLSP